MTTDIVMPNLGFDTQESKLFEWLKQPGDRVSKGEPIAVIESDKVVFYALCEIDIFQSVELQIIRAFKCH